MMKLIYSIVIAASLVSCLKKHGCTDNDAVNYSIDAKKNDNSCFYEAVGNFYWHENDYDNFLADSGSTYIYVFLDNKFIGEDSLSNFITGNLDCDDAISLPFLDTNYYEQTEIKRLKVFDQNQKLLQDTYIDIYGGCQIYQLF